SLERRWTVALRRAPSPWPAISPDLQDRPSHRQADRLEDPRAPRRRGRDADREPARRRGRQRLRLHVRIPQLESLSREGIEVRVGVWDPTALLCTTGCAASRSQRTAYLQVIRPDQRPPLVGTRAATDSLFGEGRESRRG